MYANGGVAPPGRLSSGVACSGLAIPGSSKIIHWRNPGPVIPTPRHNAPPSLTSGRKSLQARDKPRAHRFALRQERLTKAIDDLPGSGSLYLCPSALERCFLSRLRRALSGMRTAGKPTNPGGSLPGNIYAWRSEDAPLPALSRRPARSSVSHSQVLGSVLQGQRKYVK